VSFLLTQGGCSRLRAFIPPRQSSKEVTLFSAFFSLSTLSDRFLFNRRWRSLSALSDRLSCVGLSLRLAPPFPESSLLGLLLLSSFAGRGFFLLRLNRLEGFGASSGPPSRSSCLQMDKIPAWRYASRLTFSRCTQVTPPCEPHGSWFSPFL